MLKEPQTALVRHGVEIWAARRGIRRSLEHAWEHLMGSGMRLGVAPA